MPTPDKFIYSAGRNSFGSLGRGVLPDDFYPAPEKTEAPTGAWDLVATTGDSVLAIKAGKLYAWGANWNGELGLGHTDHVHSPVQVGTEEIWEKVSGTGPPGFVALKTDGTLHSAGSQWSGELGHATDPGSEFLQIGTDTDWAKLFTGIENSLAIKTNGSLWGWGADFDFNISDTNSAISTPTQIETDTDWLEAACPFSATIALKTNGTLWARGDNSRGMTGQGTFTGETETFTQIGSAEDWVRLVHASPGGPRAVGAINQAGELFVWGENDDDLGLTHSDDVNTPTKVTIPEDKPVEWAMLQPRGIIIRTTDGDYYAAGSNLDNVLFLGVDKDTRLEGGGVSSDIITPPEKCNFDGLTHDAVESLHSSDFVGMLIVLDTTIVAEFESGFTTNSSLAKPVLRINPDFLAAAGMSDETQSWISQILQSAFAVSSVSVDTAESLYHVNPFSAFTASDQLRITEVAKLLSAVDIGDELTADALQVLQLLSAVAFEDNTDTHLTAAQNFAASLTLLDAVSGAFDLNVASAAQVQAHYDAHLSAVNDLLSATTTVDEADGRQVAKVMFLSSADMDDALDSQAKMQSDLSSLLHTAVVLQIGDDIYEGWVLNVGETPRGDRTFAFSQYGNYPFTKIAEFDGKYYGVADDGLYLLEGDTDQGTAIEASFKTGLLNLGQRQIKDAKALYIGYTSDGQLVLKVTTTGGGKKREDWYRLMQKEADDMRTGRVTIQRGLRATYWQFELCNVDGADFDVDDATLLYEVLSRRIRR